MLVVGCGFIGSNVVEELVRRGTPPVVLTRSEPAPPISESIGEERLRLGDASDRPTLEAAAEGVEHLVYCAGGLLPAASERDPERDRLLTLAPLEAVLDVLAASPEVGLTYLSSGGTVYGEPAAIPVRESDPTEPIAAYGQLHLECEQMIGAARREAGLRARVLRCSTVYGEHQQPDRGQGAVVTFLHRIAAGEPIHLYGGGETVRDYVYAGDVARAVVETLDRPQAPDLLNVGSGSGTSLLEVLRLAEQQVGSEAEVRRHEERNFDVHRIVLDIGLLRDAIGFEPTSLRSGMERTHRWLRGRDA